MKKIIWIILTIALSFCGNVCRGEWHNSQDFCVEYMTYVRVALIWPNGFSREFAVMVKPNSVIAINTTNDEPFIESLLDSAKYVCRLPYLDPSFCYTKPFWKSLNSELKNQLYCFNFDSINELGDKQEELGTCYSCHLDSGIKVLIYYVDIVGLFLKIKSESYGAGESLSDEPTGIIKLTDYMYAPFCFMAFEKSNSKFVIKNDQ